MARIPHAFKKLGIALAGSLLIAVGIALLVLPGPGIAVITLGLFVLSLEFTWAERHYQRLEQHAKKIIDRLRKNT